MSATRPPMHDDRFAAPSEASRRGAHRARTKPLSAGLPVLAGIAVILLVVGGIYIVIGDNQSSSSPTDSAAAAEPETTATIPAAASTTGPATRATTSPAKQATTTPARTTTSTTTPSSSTVDQSVSLVVLNSVAVKGLAAKVETKLEGAGWKVGRTGNSINKGLATTKVYYGRSSMEETAAAVASALGYGAAVLDASVTKTGIVVVLGRDAE